MVSFLEENAKKIYKHTFSPFDIKLLASNSNSFCLICNSVCGTVPLYSTYGLKEVKLDQKRLCSQHEKYTGVYFCSPDIRCENFDPCTCELVNLDYVVSQTGQLGPIMFSQLKQRQMGQKSPIFNACNLLTCYIKLYRYRLLLISIEKSYTNIKNGQKWVFAATKPNPTCYPTYPARLFLPHLSRMQESQ